MNPSEIRRKTRNISRQLRSIHKQIESGLGDPKTLYKQMARVLTDLNDADTKTFGNIWIDDDAVAPELREKLRPLVWAGIKAQECGSSVRDAINQAANDAEEHMIFNKPSPRPLVQPKKPIEAVDGSSRATDTMLGLDTDAGGSLYVVNGTERKQILKGLTRMYQNPNGYRSYVDAIGTMENAIQVRCDRAAMAALIMANNGDTAYVHGKVVPRDQLQLMTEQYICAVQMSLCDWPLYWVGAEMLPAAMYSDIPEDIKFEDLKWPRNAMTFFLPENGWKSGNGYYKYMTICRWTDDLAVTDASIAKLSNTPEIVKQYEGFLVFYAEHSSGHIHVVTYRLSGPLSSIAYRTKDALETDHQAYADSGITPEEATTEASALVRCALNLILIMQARQELITGGGFIRKIKSSKGAGKRDLWSPRFVGRDYRFQRSDDKSTGGGTHSSPRMHWRRGHWRNTVWGPRMNDGVPIPAHLRQHRLKWIEPMLVSGKATAT